MHRVSVAIVAFTLAVAIAGCRNEKPSVPQMPPPRVTVVRAVNVPVLDAWTYNGYLEATETVEVRSKIRGFLTKIEFMEGTEVKADDPLYKIDVREFDTAVKKAKAEEAKAEAEIKNWEAQILQARADLARAVEAAKQGGASKQDYDTAQAKHDVAVAERDAAKANRDAAAAAVRTANIQLEYTDIRAKIGGRISRTHVHQGNLVQADTTLLTTILKVDKLYVYFDVPEADLYTLQKAITQSSRDPVSQQIQIEVGAASENGFPHKGYIDFRENRVETATGTIRLRGVLENPIIVNGLRLLYPGMYARVRMPKGEASQQLVLPEDVLLSGQEGRFLYVLSGDNKVEKRIVTVGASVWKAPPVTPGVTPPSWYATNPNPPPTQPGQQAAPTLRPIKSVVAITAGLKPDDRVILDGIQKVRPGAPVDPEEWLMTPPRAK